MRNLLFGLFFIVLNFIYINHPLIAAEFSDFELNKFQEKVSKKFVSKFCNSVKFGLSEDSSWKFAIGESRKELEKRQQYQYLDKDLLNKQIAKEIFNECGSVVNKSQDEMVSFLNNQQ